VEAANLTAYEWDIPAGMVRRLGEVPPDAPLGKEYTFADLVSTIHPEDQPSMVARLEATLRGDTDVYISEHRSNENPQREWCWARVRGRLIRDAEGAPLMMIGVAVDITEHKRLEEALRDADRKKDEFLATLAHELRNPLAPIRNALQLLKAQGAIRGELGLSRDIIERQVMQMARLLDDLLDVSRISRGTLELRREPIGLREVLDRALETSQPLITKNRHQFTLEMPEGEEFPLDADLVRLAQVFSNLLNNAAKYTDDGGQITVRAIREGAEAVVAVYDSGIGIDEEGLSRLFEMFAQGPGSIHRSKEGLGIGLSLARSLVSLHGGSLEATSPGIGRGSVFTVRLPLSESGAIPSKEPAQMEATPAQRPWRLVIADDLQDNTDSLADLLRLLGHEVKTAYDGAEAVEAVASFKPEAVLLDIGMPKLDGYEACRRIRATPDGRDLIIVALTGWGQSIDRERTRNAGFTQHLVKPVDYVTLLSVLNELRDGSARAH
jgi:signal transduction histidine kinase/CheY-like chemotaxis protein